LWLHSLKVAQLLRSAACLHTNQSRSYLNHLVYQILVLQGHFSKEQSSDEWRHVVWYKFTDVSENLPVSQQLQSIFIGSLPVRKIQRQLGQPKDDQSNLQLEMKLIGNQHANGRCPMKRGQVDTHKKEVRSNFRLTWLLFPAITLKFCREFQDINKRHVPPHSTLTYRGFQTK